MPKIVTAQHRAGEINRARLYLKSRLMLPTIPLGMVALLTGYGGVAFAWLQDQLTPGMFLGSTLLFVTGAAWGWAHARYDRYLLTHCPEFFARRHKILEAAKDYKKRKRGGDTGGISHPGRKFALAGYAVGVITQIGMTIYFIGDVGVYAGVFLPWAGY